MSQVKNFLDVITGRMLLLLLFLGVCATVMAQNTLHVEPVVGKVGKTISIPVSITNADEIVAAQFDITLPFTPSTSPVTLTSRANGHSVSSRINGNTVSVVLMSMENKPLRGNSGVVLRLPMTTYDDGNTNTPYPITIRKIVLADRSGKNVATETTSASTFTVSREKLPDLTVEKVGILTSTMTPGAAAKFEYTITNAGDGATEAGWTARMYLESPMTGVRTYIASQSYNQNMAAGESVHQTLSVTLPLALHLDGDVRAYVEVTPQPGCGELTVDQNNNSGFSGIAVLTKRLYLSSNRSVVEEGYGDYATLTLLRTGDWSVSETYDVSASVNGLFCMEYNAHLLPSKVTIPAGSAATTFRIYSVNDNIVRAREADINIAGAYGYNAVSCHLQRKDNDTNPLSITASRSEMTEGDELTLTVSRGGELTDELDLVLQCSNPGRFEMIPVIHFDEGQSVATVKLVAVDDDVEQLDLDVRFSLSATDYQTARTTVVLNDDDRPTISLNLSPSIVSESAGNNATTLKIQRTGKTDHAVRVKIVTDNSEVYAGATVVEIPAGSASVDVPIGVSDNTRVDATRQHTISAMLYLSANSQYVPAGDRAYSTAVLTVTDDESPYLSLSTQTSVVNEGSSVVLIVSRTVASSYGNLVVRLSSNDETCRVPATVTIPSGYSYTKFTVEINRNATADDDRTATITAVSSGLESATINLSITDRTLPDATVLSVNHETDLYAGVEATFVAEIHNDGTAVLPKETKVDFILSNYEHGYSHATLFDIASCSLKHDLPAGESATVVLKAKVPEVTGHYWLYAHVNKDGAVNEFSMANNTLSHFKSVNISAPFSVAEVATDREDYLNGEDVVVTGRMVGRLNGQQVIIRLEGNGQNTTATTNIDTNGEFVAHVKLDRSARGSMIVHATAAGQTAAGKTVTVNVINMGLSSQVTRLICDVDYEKKGTIRIYNYSTKPIHGVTVKHSTLPYGCELTLGTIPQTIAASSYADVEYTITPRIAMTGNDYINFTLLTSCEEGASADLNFAYFCRSTDCNLSFSESPLNTTLLVGGMRTVDLTITNYGLKESGLVALNIPSDVKWLSSLAPVTLPSIAPGESTTIRLLLTHNSTMHSGRTYSSFMQMVPENGATRGLNINVRVVGTEYSSLDVSAADVYSLSNGDFSKLDGADVVVSDKRSGQIVANGKLDDKGHWTTDQITEGVYTLTLSQKRHSTVTRTLNVGPGEEMSVSVLLPYKAVMTNFVTKQDYEDNSYSMVADIDIDTEAPQAIVVPTLSASGFDCGKIDADIVLRNVGSRRALYPEFRLPSQIEGVTFETQNSLPTYLDPGETFVLRVRYEGPEEGIRRVIATLPMSYSFVIDGRTLSETDLYQQLVGCDKNDSNDPASPPYIDPSNPDPDKGYDDGENSNDGNNKDDGGHSPSTSLPTIDSWYELTFDDIEKILPGQTVAAKLHIHNGSMLPMTNVCFIPTVYDLESDDELTEFINVSEGDGIDMTSTASGYNVPAMTDAYLPLSFVATESILVDGDRKVLLGGNLAYRNGGIGNTVQLPDLLVTVRPMGHVRVTYLVQRNFFGDDLSTESQRESTEPSELVMLVQNTGKTVVKDVALESSLLKVVSNSSQQAVPFFGLSSARDGKQEALDLASVGIESLDPGMLSRLAWMFGCDEMAHVENIDDYSAKKYVLNGDLEVEIDSPHELVRGVCTKDVVDNNTSALQEEYCPTDVDFKTAVLAKANAFLLNDIDDENNEPDHILFAEDGNILSVENVSQSVTVYGNSGTYTVKVKAEKAGWVYATLHDPTSGHMMLTSVKRMSDGADVSLANFWLTDRTVSADYSVMNSYDLHLADCIEGTEETYELKFTLLPDSRLDVMSIRLFTAEDKEVKAGETTKDPVVKATVEFTKPIKGNLYNQAIVFVANDQVVNLGDKAATRINESCYEINLASDMTYPGLHQLTILLSGVKDKETRKAGEGEVTVSWTENNGAKVHVDLSVAPEEKYGTLSATTDDYDFGTFSVKATPEPGYVFSHWTIDGKRAEAGPELTCELTQDVAICAYFAAASFHVEVEECDGGTIIGHVTGEYEGGTVLQFRALPLVGNQFEGWLVNGEPIRDKSNTLKLTLDSDLSVKALFSNPLDSNADGVVSIADIATAVSKGVDSKTIKVIYYKILKKSIYESEE